MSLNVWSMSYSSSVWIRFYITTETNKAFGAPWESNPLALCCERCALPVKLHMLRSQEKAQWMFGVCLLIRFRLTCGARRLWWWTVWRLSIRCRSRLCRSTSSTAPACVTRPRRSGAAYSQVQNYTINTHFTHC